MLSIENITKRFPGVIALDNVSMQLHRGKVTALLGENGAGKSTLMKILSGVYSEYEGQILFNQEKLTFRDVRDAQDSGVTMIHQELNLIPYLTVQENIFLGREIVNDFGFLDKKTMKQKTVELLARLQLKVSPDTVISDLKVGQQQVVEIAKALLNDSQIIIMDEPTSAISDKEVDVLFGIIDNLRRQDKIIIYISHKLDELFRIADHYVVMRDGTFIESGEMQSVDQAHLIRKMVGREVTLSRSTNSAKLSGEELLRVDKLCLRNPLRRNENVLNDVCLRVMSHEVVGVFGLMGAGRTELMEAIFGLHPRHTTGELLVSGKRVSLRCPDDSIRAGIALVPEDRKKDGLVLGLDVGSNLCLTTLASLERGILLNDAKEKELVEKYISELRIKTPSRKETVRNLSGGNQQKIVIGKWLAKHPKVLLLDEPTRGIDIGAKNEIYRLIQELARSGMGIVVVSSELPEILAVSDRVLVMSEGRVTADIPISEASEDSILKAAIPKNLN
ncbi:MAG: sugar ABC transporter ATP-binding protein [Chryseolinea sp.]